MIEDESFTRMLQYFCLCPINSHAISIIRYNHFSAEQGAPLSVLDYRGAIWASGYNTERFLIPHRRGVRRLRRRPGILLSSSLYEKFYNPIKWLMKFPIKYPVISSRSSAKPVILPLKDLLNDLRRSCLQPMAERTSHYRSPARHNYSQSGTKI